MGRRLDGKTNRLPTSPVTITMNTICKVKIRPHGSIFAIQNELSLLVSHLKCWWTSQSSTGKVDVAAAGLQSAPPKV